MLPRCCFCIKHVPASKGGLAAIAIEISECTAVASSPALQSAHQPERFHFLANRVPPGVDLAEGVLAIACWTSRQKIISTTHEGSASSLSCPTRPAESQTIHVYCVAALDTGTTVRITGRHTQPFFESCSWTKTPPHEKKRQKILWGSDLGSGFFERGRARLIDRATVERRKR